MCVMCSQCAPISGLTRAFRVVRQVSSRCGRFPRNVSCELTLYVHCSIDSSKIRPANGDFTVEHAVNRVFTTLVSDPVLGTYVDGQEHPGLGTTRDGKEPGSDCISNPNSIYHVIYILTTLSLTLSTQFTPRTKAWPPGPRLPSRTSLR